MSCAGRKQHPVATRRQPSEVGDVPTPELRPRGVTSFSTRPRWLLTGAMTSGPSSEPAVIGSAAASFLAFLCYFAYVFFSVPRHWGVPYKNRFVPLAVLAGARAGLLREVSTGRRCSGPLHAWTLTYLRRLLCVAFLGEKGLTQTGLGRVFRVIRSALSYANR